MKIDSMKRILVLGGGFAGVECCLKLESYFKNNPEIEITMVSEDNFILFTPSSLLSNYRSRFLPQNSHKHLDCQSY